MSKRPCRHPVRREIFLEEFWKCFNRLEDTADEMVGKAAYFRFLTLLGEALPNPYARQHRMLCSVSGPGSTAYVLWLIEIWRCDAGLQIFLRQKVDTAVLEVGLGGRLDATNVVREPYVCGITSLGYDHMEILGHTLPEIAAEKAGILKKGAPAFTVQQPADAMKVLQVTPYPADLWMSDTGACRPLLSNTASCTDCRCNQQGVAVLALLSVRHHQVSPALPRTRQGRWGHL